jgi:hypothetical protein
MKNIGYLFLIWLALTSCSDKNISIHKLWKFVKYDVINPNPNQTLNFGSSDKIDYLDLRKNDTLEFLLENKKPPQPISYEIADSIIIMKGPEGKIKFKVWNLTKDKLELVIIIDKIKANNNLIEMVFSNK